MASFPEWESGSDVDTWVQKVFGKEGWDGLRQALAKMGNRWLEEHRTRGTKEKGGYPGRVRKEMQVVLDARSGAAEQTEAVRPSQGERARREPAAPTTVAGAVAPEYKSYSKATLKELAAKGDKQAVVEMERRLQRRQARGQTAPAQQRPAAETPAKPEKPTHQAAGGPGRVSEFFNMSNSELREAAAKGESGALKELQRRGKPVEAPSGHMRDVIAGRAPREEKAPSKTTKTPSPQPTKAQKARREPAATNDYFQMGNAALRDAVAAGDEGALAELQRRGKPVEAPSHHMRDVIAGRVPREQAEEAPVEPSPGTTAADITPEVAPELAEEDEGQTELTWGEMVGQQVNIALPEATEGISGELLGLEGNKVFIRTEDGEELMLNSSDIESMEPVGEEETPFEGAPEEVGAAPAEEEQEPAAAERTQAQELYDAIGSGTLAGTVAKLRVMPKAYEVEGLRGFLPPNMDNEPETVYILKDMVKNRRPGIVVEIEGQMPGAQQAGRPQVFIPRSLIQHLKPSNARWGTTTPRPGQDIRWIDAERARRQGGDVLHGEPPELHPLSDIAKYTNDIVYSRVNGEWMHLRPIAQDEATGDWRFEVAGEEGQGREILIGPKDSFEFLPPYRPHQDDRYIPAEEEGMLRRRESLLRARRELSGPGTSREDELGIRAAQQRSDQVRSELGPKQLDVIQRLADVLREARQAGLSPEQVNPMYRSAMRQLRDPREAPPEADLATEVKLRMRNMAGLTDATKAYNAAREIAGPTWDEQQADKTWLYLLQNAGYEIGEGIPPRPDQAGGTERRGAPSGESGKGGPMQFSALANEPFGEDFQGFRPFVAGTAGQRRRDISLPARSSEYAVEQTGNVAWADVARQALEEMLRGGVPLQPGEVATRQDIEPENPELGQLGEEPVIANPMAGAEGAGWAPFLNNFQALSQNARDFLSPFVNLEPQKPMELPLPGMAPGEQERLKELGQRPPQPVPTPQPPTGFPASQPTTPVSIFPRAPEEITNPMRAQAQPQATPGPMPGAGWTPPEGGGINIPFGEVWDVIRRTIPADALLQLLSGGGATQPAPMMPGGAPGGVPVPAAMAPIGQQQAALGQAIANFVPDSSRLAEWFGNPENRPVYGLTEAGPIPMGTQGGWEQGKEGLIRLLQQLGIPGF